MRGRLDQAAQRRRGIGDGSERYYDLGNRPIALRPLEGFQADPGHRGNGRGGGFDCSAMDWFIERARALGVEHRPPPPILMGRHLLEMGLQPGPAVGVILKAVYELQLDGKVTNLDEAIACLSDADRQAILLRFF